MAYAAPAASSIHFSLGSAYAPPIGNHVAFLMDSGTGSWFSIGGSSSVHFDNYFEAKTADLSVGAGSTLAFVSEAQSPMTFGIAGVSEVSIALSLDKLARFRSRALARTQFTVTAVAHASFTFKGLSKVDFHRDYFFTINAASTVAFKMEKVLPATFSCSSRADNVDFDLVALKAAEWRVTALAAASFSGDSESRPLPKAANLVIYVRTPQECIYVG